jgi:GT2 family glycosyltransferase
MGTFSPPSVSLIVVNYEAAELCVRLVRSLAGAVRQIIVVDNASSDRDELSAIEALDGVEILRLNDNRGYGAGANAGRAIAAGDVLVVANPDVSITASDLQRLAREAAGTGIAGPRFHHPDGTLQRSAHRREPVFLTTLFELCVPLSGVVHRLRPDWHPTLFSSRQHEEDLVASHLLGACMAVDVQAWDAIGGFDEDFFLYREETDLCVRARAAGWRIHYVADTAVEHISGASSRSALPLAARSPWLESHYRYIAKHHGRWTARVARVLGALGCLVTMLQPKRRHAARASLRWHLHGR